MASSKRYIVRRLASQSPNIPQESKFAQLPHENTDWASLTDE